MVQIQVRINHYKDSCSPADQQHTALYVEAELAGHGLSLGQSQRTAFAQLQGDSYRWHSILTFPQKVRLESHGLVSMLEHSVHDVLAHICAWPSSFLCALLMHKAPVSSCGQG